jgi:hypothetical protein
LPKAVEAKKIKSKVSRDIKVNFLFKRILIKHKKIKARKKISEIMKLSPMMPVAMGKKIIYRERVNGKLLSFAITRLI